ncbi:MAG: hypothetical protein GXP25_09755 [Planctomycetes bacterium]|nr:hypothetical protein [Planctomycetota bacterium]
MRAHVAFAFAIIVLLGCEGMPSELTAAEVPNANFYVATNGSDSWSGKLPAPNAGKTDGPFATLARARDAVRKITPKTKDIIVMVRGGTYYLPEALTFGPKDSGNENGTISYVACPGEEVVLSGGRPITDWKPVGNGLYAATLPDVKAGHWYFRQLRVGDRRQHQARHPNYDEKDPIKGGWILVDKPQPMGGGAFGASVTNIHNRGDFIEWEVHVPADGRYRLFLYAAVKMKPFGRDGMAGQTGFSVDGGEPIVLNGPAETGNWKRFKWSECAALDLKAGKRILRWTNLKGGGINFDAFCLTDDPAYTPKGTQLAPPAPGGHLILVQAEAFAKAEGKQMKVSLPRVYDRFFYPEGAVKAWPKSPDKEIHIFPAWGWVNSINRIDRIDEETRTIFLKPKCQADLRVGNRFFIANVREALDAPGEFYLDKATGVLTYLPEDADFTRKEVVAPAMKRIVFLRGDSAENRTEYIHFRGFTFKDTQYSPAIASLYYPPDGAIAMQDAAHNRIQDCTFEHLGGWALVGVGATDQNEFVGNTVRYVGQGGVFLCGQTGKGKMLIGDDPETGGFKLPGEREAGSGPTGNIISGNHIHHIGLVYAHVAGFYGETTHENIISHNYIHDVPRYGISLKRKCRGNRIEFNEVRRTNLETNDTGAIETYTTTTPNVINNNLVVDSIGLKVTEDKVWHTPFYSWGIYLDGYSSNQTVTNNIVLRNVRGGIMVNGGWDNHIENNIFANGSDSLIFLNNYLGKYKGNKLLRNIIYSDLDPPAPVRTSRWKPDLDFLIDFNLYWIKTGKPPEITAAPWEKWREWGFDKDSIVADPMFEDVSKEDFRLKPDSPALKLGFKQIPVEKIGIVPER